jgi:hypothetical protein
LVRALLSKAASRPGLDKIERQWLEWAETTMASIGRALRARSARVVGIGMREFGRRSNGRIDAVYALTLRWLAQVQMLQVGLKGLGAE